MDDNATSSGVQPVHGVWVIMLSAAAVLAGLMALGFRPKSK